MINKIKIYMTLCIFILLYEITEGDFLMEPLSQNVTVETTVNFSCRHETAIVTWEINDQDISDYPAHASIVGSVHTLTIIEPSLKYNRIIIQCIARLVSGREVSLPATLLLQGPLDAVRDTEIYGFNSTISWNPPPSLDLTNVEPDIVYCVDVYNITCGGRELLISDCNVTETSYTSDVIVPDGYIYEYVVTPRSNVEGAKNGTSSQPLRNNLPTFNVSSTRLSDDIVGQNPDLRAYQTELNYTPNLPIPSSYSLSLQSLDGLEDMDHVETTATIEPSVLTLEVVSGLPFRRLWNCTVLAYGCKENNILNDELSTYDFRDIVSFSLDPGEVRVTGSFTDDSTATGVLVIVIGDSKVIYHKASQDGTDKIKGALITGLAGGEYSISIFVVEENGLPFERVATSPKLVAVEKSESDVTPPSSSIEYSLQSTSTGVCITCTFLDSSATDCVAVVHQRISQLNSSGLMNIKSHKLTRSGDIASGCIEGVNMEDYQVGVVGGRQVTLQEQGSKICDGCIAGSVLAVLLLFVVLAVVIKLIHKMKMKRRVFRSQNSDIERRLCLRTNVYEEGPNLKEHICETTPLRVESDSPLSSESREPPGLQAPSTLPPVTPHSAGLEPNEVVPEPTYAEPEFSKKKIISAPFADRVKYDDVKVFKNPQGQDYAMVGLPSSSGQTVPDDLHKTTSEYSQIRHDQYRNEENVTTQKETKTEPEKCTQQCVVTPHALYTVENLVPILHPICSKWKKLGTAMSMYDDHLDQVFTNNEGDEAYLRDLLERYMDNGEFQHNWEEMIAILEKMDENALASDIYDLHVHPYVDSLLRDLETQKESELAQEELDDLLVKEPPSEGQGLDEGSSHRQTHEEPNLTLELMHKESDLTQNEVHVEPTDNLAAEEPQPEKPSTDSTSGQTQEKELELTQEEQSQSTGEYTWTPLMVASSNVDKQEELLMTEREPDLKQEESGKTEKESELTNEESKLTDKFPTKEPHSENQETCNGSDSKENGALQVQDLNPITDVLPLDHSTPQKKPLESINNQGSSMIVHCDVRSTRSNGHQVSQSLTFRMSVSQELASNVDQKPTTETTANDLTSHADDTLTQKVCSESGYKSASCIEENDSSEYPSQSDCEGPEHVPAGSITRKDFVSGYDQHYSSYKQKEMTGALDSAIMDPVTPDSKHSMDKQSVETFNNDFEDGPPHTLTCTSEEAL